MKVFVTGASGHIGSLVTAELIAAGHRVVGLARSDAGAARIASLGAEPLVGTIDQPGPLAEAAGAADGVVHLAFKHDFSDFMAAIQTDRTVIDAIADALDGSGKPFHVASGTMMLAAVQAGRIGTEDMVGDPESSPNPRAATESVVLGLAQRGIASAALRFSPSVHGPTDLHGFIPTLIAKARENGFAGYVGDGENRWPAVHNLDTAHLIRLGLEQAPAGVALHAVGDEGIPFRQIAEAIGRGAGVPTRSLSPEEAAERIGFIGAFMGVDNPTSSVATQELLGWAPTHPGLIADLDEGFYFNR
jgi:nucleoside-diphosphate-sugar epimerase